MTANASLPPADEQRDPAAIPLAMMAAQRSRRTPSTPADEQRQPPLGEEELAELESWALTSSSPLGRWVPRLIAALRASRAEVERLRENDALLRDALSKARGVGSG